MTDASISVESRESGQSSDFRQLRRRVVKMKRRQFIKGVIGISTTAILPFQAGAALAAMEVSRDLGIA
jgi:hypothetical protein